MIFGNKEVSEDAYKIDTDIKDNVVSMNVSIYNFQFKLFYIKLYILDCQSIRNPSESGSRI